MLKLAAFVIATFAGASAALIASPSAASSPAAQDGSKPVCKYVLATDPGAQPYKLCQTAAQWASLEASYAKDADRMVCHYEELPGTKIGAHKICGPLSVWEARRQQARESTEKIQMLTGVPR